MELGPARARPLTCGEEASQRRLPPPVTGMINGWTFRLCGSYVIGEGFVPEMFFCYFCFGLLRARLGLSKV